jgi:hypothetical protein
MCGRVLTKDFFDAATFREFVSHLWRCIRDLSENIVNNDHKSDVKQRPQAKSPAKASGIAQNAGGPHTWQTF